MTNWRYFATTINGNGTETMLHPDLPLSKPEIFWQLSGPGGITGGIEPEMRSLKSNGRPVFKPWSTTLYAEADGVIRQGCIFTGFTERGPRISLNSIGFSGYAKGMPYSGQKAFLETDALDITRHIWEHLQGHPGGNLGLTFDPNPSGIRLGIPESAEHRRRRLNQEFWEKAEKDDAARFETAKKDVYDRNQKVFREVGIGTDWGEVIRQKGKPTGDRRWQGNVWIKTEDNTLWVVTTKGADWVPWWGDGDALRWAHEACDAVDRAAHAKDIAASTKAARVDADEYMRDLEGGEEQPYVLSALDTHDLGGTIDELARLTPFDYRVDHTWEGETIKHRMQFGYPYIGQRKENLRFVVGENVFDRPELDYTDEDYASEIMVLGAGDAEKMVRGHASRPTDRLRRVGILQDKNITSTDIANQRAQQDLRFRSGEIDLDEIVVMDHPNAPLGSYGVGDEIPLGTAQGWSDNLELWCRITAMSVDPTTGLTRLSIVNTEKVA